MIVSKESSLGILALTCLARVDRPVNSQANFHSYKVICSQDFRVLAEEETCCCDRHCRHLGHNTAAESSKETAAETTAELLGPARLALLALEGERACCAWTAPVSGICGYSGKPRLPDWSRRAGAGQHPQRLLHHYWHWHPTRKDWDRNLVEDCWSQRLWPDPWIADNFACRLQYVSFELSKDAGQVGRKSFLLSTHVSIQVLG